MYWHSCAEREWGEAMRTVETEGIVTPDGRLSVRVPADIPPGQHRVVVVIDEQPVERGSKHLPDFPVIDPGPWPDNLSLRREDMYGANGR